MAVSEVAAAPAVEGSAVGAAPPWNPEDGRHRGEFESAASEAYAEYVRVRGGDRVVRRILVANNGLGAVKCIRSIRQWCYTTFGARNLVHFIVMATPDDVANNAEYFRLADEFVDVPGGANGNNYANVALIAETAARVRADAVWPGWGHASEKPELPRALEERGVLFMGPPADAMDAVGDKICANLLAQSVGVNVIPWSGEGLTVPGASIPPDVLARATVHDVSGALQVAQRIGYPAIIKASEGGGGKGIRKVTNDAELKTGFEQVQAEVPGSPIFVQKLALAARHLEVQIVADKHGQAAALFGRDCSVQRRHQKMIEEGPVKVAPLETCRELEEGAVRLAKLVGYSGAGTMEYLYSPEAGGEYSFLEVNPRLQVEHPVTEAITGVNLPATQLQIAMGIPLDLMPDIRRLYGASYETGLDRLDLEASRPPRPEVHCVAARITAENPEEGFKPTSGRIDELHCRSVRNVHATFSVGSSGGVHQFADSQFGHLFSIASTREAATKQLVVALGEFSIRGEISHNVNYLCHILEHDDFVRDVHDTAWLDGLIAARAGLRRVPAEVAVTFAAVVLYQKAALDVQREQVELLERGIAPRLIYRTGERFDIIYDDLKYAGVHVDKGSSTSFNVTVNDGPTVEAEAADLFDSGLVIVLEGRSHVVYAEFSALGLRLTIDGQVAFFPKDFDPTRLVAASAGKLVRYLVESGAPIKAGEPYAEVEVMKMVMPVAAGASGVISHALVAGAPFNAGDLLARLALEAGADVKVVEQFRGTFPPARARASPLPGAVPSDRALLREFEGACSDVLRVFEGFNPQDNPVGRMLSLLYNPHVILAELEARVAESAAARQLSSTLHGRLTSLLAEARDGVDHGAEALPEQLFGGLLEAFDKAEDEGASLLGSEAAAEVLGSIVLGGVEARAAGLLATFVSAYLEGERPFDRFQRYEDAVLALLSIQRENGEPLSRVGDLMASHAAVARKNEALLRVLSHFQERSLPLPLEKVEEVANLQKFEYGSVVQKAKELLIASDKEARESNRLKKRVSDGYKTLRRKHHERGMSLTSVDSEGESLVDFGAEAPAPDLLDENSMVRRRRQSSMAAAEAMALEQLEALERLQLEGGAEKMDPSALAGAMPELFARQVPYGNFFRHDAPAEQADALKAYLSGLSLPDVVCVREHGFIKVQLWPDAACYVVERPQDAQTVLRAVSSRGTQLSTVLFLLPRDETSGWSAQISELCSSLATDYRSLVREGVSTVSFGAVRTGEADGIEYATFHLAEKAVEESKDPAAALLEQSKRALGSIDPVLTQQLELGRLGLFDLSIIEDGTMPTVQRIGAKAGLAMPMNPDYRTLILLAQEMGSSGRDRDRRVFARAAVYNKDLFFAVEDAPAMGADGQRKPRRMPSGGNLMKYGALGSAIGVNGKSGIGKQARISPDNLLVELLGSLELAVGRKGTAWNHIFVSLTCLDDDRMDPEVDPGIVEAVVNLFVIQFASELRALKVSDVEVAFGSYRVLAYNPTGHKFRVTLKHTGVIHGNTAETLKAYPVLNRVQRKQMMAQNLMSTYVYDFTSLFEDEVRSQGTHGSCDFEAREMVLNSQGSLEVTARPPGHNDVGTVVWRCRIVTPEYPGQGREVILVGSDITHQSGSFAPEEDLVYCKAFELAMAQRVPCVYISANSGARIGLDKDVQGRFRIKWEDDQNPSKGFRYLYLDDKDYEYFSSRGSVRAVQEGPNEWRLTDIMGGLGVECLQGSGMIARVTSAAYEETFTLTYVTGRSVGIGAYVSRLSQRIIQHREAPLILTGAAALNKLLGKEVYSSNVQIGGADRVMAPNGVSHQVVKDDVQGVQHILRWLSYVPARAGDMPRLVSPKYLRAGGGVEDPVTRAVEYMPTRAAYDPRHMLAGTPDGDLKGFFDTGSFTEYLSEWGKTVVVGRATLGGIPCGVVSVESRTVEKITPADPGLPSSRANVEQQAGNVWFPDSAYKTAQTVRDLNREGLPLLLFANWRGFAGGLRDMYGEVLKYGSYIVDALREYKQPILTYIPHEAELRGGAWVVIDSTINPDQMEMYAAETCRGNILEPEGICEIKFREGDLHAAMARNEPEGSILGRPLPADADEIARKEARRKQREAMPLYKSAAVAFAALHDTSEVMKAKGVIRDVVPWQSSRAFFHLRLRTRLVEEHVKRLARAAFVSAAPGVSEEQCREIGIKAVAALRTQIDGLAACATEPVDALAKNKDLVSFLSKVRRDAFLAHVSSLSSEDRAALSFALTEAMMASPR